MELTGNEVRQFVEEEDIKFIRLAFCDVYGQQKNVAILPDELERAFTSGIAMDGSAIRGFGRDVKSDLFLHPDPSTLERLPWRPDTAGVIRMFCAVTEPDGTPIPADSRNILKKAIEDAKREGIAFEFGAEMEFYLFRLDDDGAPTMVPYDRAGYMDIAPLDKGENIRREICLTLEQMGIKPECSHHEEGPGQNEIDFRYGDALRAADNAMTFRPVVQTISAASGLYADFSPKPLKGAPGNGMHINISARTNGGCDVLDAIMAGIMHHIREMTLFLNPLDASYDRLGGSKAPRYVSWSHANRSQLVRFPATPGTKRRAELRSPDPMCNPYLAYALLIEAGLEGIRAGMQLPPEADLNLYTAPADVVAGFEKLPVTRVEAARAAAESDFIRKYLPEDVLAAYLETRL